MILALGLIQQQRRRLSGVDDNNVNFAVVVKIAERRPTPGSIWDRRERGRNIFEGAVAFIPEQQHGFAIGSCTADLIHLRIYVAVRDEQIQPASVVHIEKTGSPSDQG